MVCNRAKMERKAPTLAGGQGIFPSCPLTNPCSVEFLQVHAPWGAVLVKKFIVVSFGFMAWAFYELSGGADFVPETRPLAQAPIVAQDKIDAAVVADPEPQVVMASLVVDTAPDVTPVADPVVSQEFVSLSTSPTGLIAPTETPPGADVMTVTAQSLNVRSGPSTNNAVIGKLTQYENVSLVQETADGWALIRIEGDGIEGWVARRFLTN